ncbi:hypothetical protein [Dyadobacter psychrotolerans]|uniref:DUF2383 domain-containing protein n=1 Tax=Dyadobacter psychrotolerans TaxID=2541721 RepID=A0A4R5DQM9_9BACT|nr:hypothetical protein [Dyadobacter psychrotolerans]TDE14490.1 hypothetical protein E0F88_14925 [Dyadobacter psychrotolerans]
MDNLPTFVTSIVRLWNVNQHREDLYKQAMALDNVGSLRKICSHGFISSLLFKKELQWVYDGIKCALSDGEIGSILGKKTEQNDASFFSAQDKLSIARILREQERRTIKLYKATLNAMNLSYDENQILTDHLEKLKDLDFNINRELINSYENFQPFQNPIA